MLVAAPDFASAQVAVQLNPPGFTTDLVVRASAGLGQFPLPTGTQLPASFPYSDEDLAQQGASISAAMYDFETVRICAGSVGFGNPGENQCGDFDVFHVEFDQQRGTATGASTHASAHIFFSVAEPSTYSISGTYAMFDSVGRQLSWDVWLYDETARTTVFLNTQASSATPFESLTVGRTGGDQNNNLEGEPSGDLSPGHVYRFEYVTVFDGSPSGVSDEPTPAGGSLTLWVKPPPDSDSDGVSDLDDNCTDTPNPDQADVDFPQDDHLLLPGVQHYGDACDADLNNDGAVGALDWFGALRPCLGLDPAIFTDCQRADLDGDGVVGPTDWFGVMRPAFGGSPGPGVTE